MLKEPYGCTFMYVIAVLGCLNIVEKGQGRDRIKRFQSYVLRLYINPLRPYVYLTSNASVVFQ